MPVDTQAVTPRAAMPLDDKRVGFALLTAAVLYFGLLAPYGLNLDDEGTILYQIYRTYLGQVLYVDFHAGYTPGLFYWNAALFWLFGVNVVVLRLGLALINGLTVYGMYWLARRLGASTLAAATAGLLYVAFIPFYDGQFGAFNIPYPTWYVSVFWLASVMCVVRWWESRRSLWWLPAGLCTGVVFAFKPNSGLLDLAGLLIALAVLERPAPDTTPGRGWLSRVLIRAEHPVGWLIPAGLTLALTWFLGRGAGWREVWLFALPLIVVVGYQLLLQASRQPARAAAPFSRWCNLLAVGSGFALVTLPWTVYFWSRLGTRPFLRAVLFLGTGFDRFYYIAYPPIGLWGLGTAGVFVVSVGIGMLLRRRLLPPAVLVAALVCGGLGATLWLWRHPPPMVEGFQASVVMRVRDVAFVVVLMTEWAAVLTYIVQSWRGRVFAVAAAPGERDSAQRLATLFVLIVCGILMHMQLYPRTDFMHLVVAIPGVLILAAWLVHLLAELWARGLTAAPAWRRLIAAAVLAPLYALVLIMIAPALGRITYLARSWWAHDPTAVVRLDSARAPLVVEPAAGRSFLALSSTARFLREHSRPDEAVFTFPALDLVCFLADRQNPTRHGYFFPRWPGHDVEAEVIDALQARPPRFIVAMHYHALFFGSAPLYYFSLRRYITSHYRLERRIGLFDVLAPVSAQTKVAALPSADGDSLADALRLWRVELQHRAGATARATDAALAALPAASAWDLANALPALAPAQQQLLAELIRTSRSAAGAAAAAMVLENYVVPGTLHDYLIRVIAEFGDDRAVVPLLGWLANAEIPDRATIAGLLFIIAQKISLEDYLYTAPNPRELADIGEVLNAQQLIIWIDNPFEFFGLRFFAIGMAAAQRDPLVIPVLARVLGDSNEPMDLRLAAARSLVKLGFGRQVLPTMINRLRDDDLFAALIVAMYDADSDDGRDPLVEAMRAADDDPRTTAFWVAAAVRDPRLREPLQLGLSDRVPQVQMAAAWGLGNLRDTESVAALERLASDGNDQVAAFARRALGRVRSEE